MIMWKYSMKMAMKFNCNKFQTVMKSVRYRDYSIYTAIFYQRKVLKKNVLCVMMKSCHPMEIQLKRTYNFREVYSIIFDIGDWDSNLSKICNNMMMKIKFNSLGASCEAEFKYSEAIILCVHELRTMKCRMRKINHCGIMHSRPSNSLFEPRFVSSCSCVPPKMSLDSFIIA